MKTRLLKKIRKRYSITRVDSLSSKPISWEKAYKDELGLPYHKLYDSEDEYLDIFKTYDACYEILKKWIIKDYGEKFRHKPGKETKVWYNKK